MSHLRIYLTGSVCLERGDVLVPETRLPGRQGRLALAMLVAERQRAFAKEELADEIWGGAPPASWEIALRSLLSKLRSALAEAGLDGEALGHAFGAYQLHLPPDAWVDLDAAGDAVHRAEDSLHHGDRDDAMGWSLAANAIARRGFLPGEDSPWASGRRAWLHDVHVRALECRAQVLLERRDLGGAARDALRIIDLEPFRETAYQLLMRAHADAGNPAEALRAYERCRSTLAEELGADPSAEIEALHLQILRGPPGTAPTG